MAGKYFYEVVNLGDEMEAIHNQYQIRDKEVEEDDDETKELDIDRNNFQLTSRSDFGLQYFNKAFDKEKLTESNINLSLVERRLYFAEIGLDYEKAVYYFELKREKLNRGVACYRIALHYLNGLGIDITDLESRNAADFQAMIYLQEAIGGGCIEANFQAGLLLTSGRACEASNESIKNGIALLEVNSNQNHYKSIDLLINLKQHSIGKKYDNRTQYCEQYLVVVDEIVNLLEKLISNDFKKDESIEKFFVLIIFIFL